MDMYDLEQEGVPGAGTLAVLEYQTKQTRNCFNNVYVKCFPTEFTEDDLINIFKIYGEIQSAVIMRDA